MHTRSHTPGPVVQIVGPLLDSELLSRGKPAEVPHVSHQLVVLHAMVDVRDEHLHRNTVLYLLMI